MGKHKIIKEKQRNNRENLKKLDYFFFSTIRKDRFFKKKGL